MLDLIHHIVGSLGGWLIVAAVAVVALYVVLRIVGRAISAALRLAIILGTVVVIVLAFFALSAALHRGGLPTL